MFALFVDFLRQHPKTESHSKAQADMENQHRTKAELTRVGLCSPWWVSGGPAGRKLFLLMPNEMQLRSVELNYQELIQWKVTGASSALLQKLYSNAERWEVQICDAPSMYKWSAANVPQGQK